MAGDKHKLRRGAPVSCERMAAPPTPPTPEAPERGFRAWLRALPRWKKITVGVALVTVVVAGALSLASGGTPAGGGGSGGPMSGLSSNLVERPAAGGAPAAGEPAAKGVFRIGFSFLAGFCIGAFLRAALKVAAIAFGFWLLATMALSYYGVLAVDWTAISSLWDRFAGNVSEEWGSFQSFVTGSLPAAGLAVAGLAMGLKRNR